MRLFVASLCLGAFAIVAACGGSDGGSLTPPDTSDGGAITMEAGPGEAGPTDAQAGADAADGGESSAIVAPNDTWTWVDFPTSKCGSGTPTGIGVNPHAGAKELVIYMEGGGSCTTGETCWGPTPGATFMPGFGAADFPKQKSLNLPILNRGIMANPLANDSYVYVPYCTGDLHGGHTEVDLDVNGTTKPTYFWGGADMDLFLARLVPTFPNLTRVVLTGTSAGGFGSFIAFDKTVRAFGGIRVDIIDDSGPPIPPAVGDGSATGGVWKIDKPAGCPSCQTLRDIFDADRAQQPNSRYGLLTYNRDSVIAPDFGYTVDEYPAIIDTFTSSISADSKAHVYEVNLTPPAGEHVVQAQLALAGYLPWMTKLLNDDPTWANEMATPP